MSNSFGRKLALAMCLAAALCLFANIGVNQALASYRPPQEDQGCWDVPQSPGTLTIAGTWKYYDRSNNLVPAKKFLVELLTAADEHLAWDYTNNSGYFCFEPVPNPGVTIMVRIYTFYYYADYDSELTVAEPDGSSWQDAHSHTSEDKGPYSDGYHYVGILEVPSWLDELDAWWIKGDLNKGFLFLPDKEGDFFAEWDPDSGSNYNFFCCCNIPVIWLCNLGHIYLKPNAAKNRPDVVLHEMGHAVMWNVYDEYWPLSCWDYFVSGCYNHVMYEAFGAECAWTEGWANFWAIYVKGSPYLFGYNLENKDWDTPDWDDGDEVEGRVAGALWDLVDSPADYWDQCDGYFDDIWDTISSQTDGTFEEFWNAWKVGKSDQVFFEANGSLYQNTIDYPDERLVQGDANEDGGVDMGDVTRVERIIFGLTTPTVGADANKDREINMGDVTCIERIILGLGC